MAPKKPPRRTAERILETTLELFNRFGEPNVSTTLISAELNISPGNLYYHYPAKEELVNALYKRYESALDELLPAADAVANIEDAWLFFHLLFELIWRHRFLYRDLNDLLSKNRKLETHFQYVLKSKTAAVTALIYWLSYEYVRDPRRALEPETATAALGRGAFHTLALLGPYLDAQAREHLHRLAERYMAPPAAA
jgi:AcrR family transcriptional regulator